MQDSLVASATSAISFETNVVRKASTYLKLASQVDQIRIGVEKVTGKRPFKRLQI